MTPKIKVLNSIRKTMYLPILAKKVQNTKKNLMYISKSFCLSYANRSIITLMEKKYVFELLCTSK